MASARPQGLGGGGVGVGWVYSLIWPIQGRAAGQGMVFGISVLNGVYRIYNFIQIRS